MMTSRPFSASELNKLDEDMSWYDDPEMPSWVTDEQHRKSSRMNEDEIRELEGRVKPAGRDTMTDIINRAEAAMRSPRWATARDLVPELVTELKAARAENEWLSNNLQVMAGKYKDLHERLADALVAFHHDAHNARK